MRNIALITILLIANTGCAEFKDAGRSIGHGTRDAAVAIGQGTKRVVNEAAKSTEEATQ